VHIAYHFPLLASSACKLAVLVYQCVHRLAPAYLADALHSLSLDFLVEMCMGMGKTGIPWVPRDSHGNRNKMGIRWMGMGIR